MLDKGFTSERCPHPSLRYAPRPLRWRKVVRMAANLGFASSPSHPACERGARSCQSERLTPSQPSPSLREREGATAVVPSHARHGALPTKSALTPPLRAPALALAQGRSNGCEPLVRKQPLSRMRERGSELSERTAHPSPTLPFATRKGGSNSGSAEPCSARALPANAALTSPPATRPGPCAGARSFEWLRTFGSQATPLPHAGEGLKRKRWAAP